MHQAQIQESGNVLFIILIVIVLLGLLSVAIQSTSYQGSENIDQETLIIRWADVRQHAAEIETAVRFIFQNDFSEIDIRFAHPNANTDYGLITDNPERQVFSPQGGGASYKTPPSGINDGSNWEFYGGTHMPDVGSDRAELVALLPNVSDEFCDFVNDSVGYTGIPNDNGNCVYEAASGRFDGGTLFATTPNTTEEATFSETPSYKACITCQTDGSKHYVHVLMAR